MGCLYTIKKGVKIITVIVILYQNSMKLKRYHVTETYLLFLIVRSRRMCNVIFLMHCIKNISSNSTFILFFAIPQELIY